MDTRTSQNNPTMPLLVTRDEVYALMMALLNASVDLGVVEQPLCHKVREAWDALRVTAPGCESRLA